MRALGAAVVVAVAGLLAACSSGHAAGSASSSAAPAIRTVAWDGAVPAALQPEQIRPAGPCPASRLRLVGAGFLFAPDRQGGTGTITLRNIGPGPCRLSGRPQVRLVGAALAPRQQQVPLAAQTPPFPQVLPPLSTLLALPAGGMVTLGVNWRNWCVPGAPARAVAPPKAVRITLPGRGSLDVGYNAVPSCDAPRQPSTVGVQPFQPAPLRTPPWTRSAVKATIEGLGGAPLTGRRGQITRYAVRLTNASRAQLVFTRCPLVVETLAPAGSVEVHQLNCRGAAPLAPGASLRFEMRIRVPMSAPLGNNGLFWELDPAGVQGPQVVSGVNVAG